LFDRPDETSVSTTQLFAIAARQGMRLFAVTAQNLNQVQSLGTSREVKEDIANAVAAGRVAFVPEGDIDHRGFRGVGYLLLDPTTGAAAYLIDGGANGGKQRSCSGSAKAPVDDINFEPLAVFDVLTAYGLDEVSQVATAPVRGEPALELAGDDPMEYFRGEPIRVAALGSVSIGLDMGLTPSQLGAPSQVLAFKAAPRDPILVKALGVPYRAFLQRVKLLSGLTLARFLPGAGVAVGVAQAAGLLLLIYQLAWEIKLILAENGIGLQTRARTDQDSKCECKGDECPCATTRRPKSRNANCR
jgi:hypothetical protein